MITQATTANLDPGHSREVLDAAYRQVFGNMHLMELDVLPSIDALFMNGDLTVQGLITAMAQSETYRKTFLETNSPYRFVELNFKHLLGRSPNDQAEVMEHVRLMADEGFNAEIASYTYSDEYLKTFGVDQVPFLRNKQTTVGSTTLAYNRANVVDPGTAGFDGVSRSRLLSSLATGKTPDLVGRKSVGIGSTLTVLWKSRKQLGANRRVAQRSVVSQTSLSATVKSIHQQGGQIVSITTNS